MAIGEYTSSYPEYSYTEYRPALVEPMTFSSPSVSRLQVMHLPNDRFILVIDNWSGLGSEPEWVEDAKEATGASAVLFFSTTIDVM